LILRLLFVSLRSFHRSIPEIIAFFEELASSVDHTLTFPRNISDALVEVDTSQTESVRDEEIAIVEEQKDEGKLGFCELQWQQQSPLPDGRKFTKKNFKRLDDAPVTKLNLSITKIDEEDQMQIIPLSSPMKVRSPLGFRSCQSLAENPIKMNVAPKIAPVHHSVSNIKTLSVPPPIPEDTTHDHLRKTSLLSLKSLSMSLRLLRRGTRSDSLEHVESNTLETIEETKRKSIFQMEMFERNLKKFVTKSNEADFQSYSEYQQQQQQHQQQPAPKKGQKSFFKNQKIYDRRSSTSDIHEANPKNIHHYTGISTSSSNVKHDNKKHHKDEQKAQKEKDKTAEMLKEVRKRNLETSKRISSAPRRISTAY
jgi:hypothetical protein